MDTKYARTRSDSGFGCVVDFTDRRLSRGTSSVDKGEEDLGEGNIIDLQPIEAKIDANALKNEILVDGMQVWLHYNLTL